MSTLILASPERFATRDRRSFSATAKVNVVESFLQQINRNVSQAAREHSIDRATLIRWVRDREGLLQLQERKSTARRASGAGRPSTMPDNVKDALLSFVETRRDDFLPVTPRMLYLEWCRIDADVLQLSEAAARQRIYRFMSRNDLVMRRTTHHAQSTRTNPKVITDWMDYIGETCKTYGITQDRIANFDETDVQFSVQTQRTLAHRGQRTVSVRTPTSSGRCSVMLGVAADGHKFPPYIIFKGLPGARIDRELRRWEHEGYSEGCIYGVQSKAWMNEPQMLQWVEKVWKPYTNSKNGDMTMLIIDQMSVHCMPTVKKAIEDCGTLLEFIPKGYTSVLQVCDIGLNKPFKDYMRAAVNEWMVSSGTGSNNKPDRITVSHWIDHAWNRISHNTVINTWVHIGVTDSIGCEEDGNKDDDEEIEGGFLTDTDAREDDVLALRESDEISSDEEDE